MKKAFEIKLGKQSKAKLSKKLFQLRQFSELQFQYEVHKAGLTIAADVKRKPIPVDTGNLRRNVRWNGKSVKSAAPYSAFLEYGTKYMQAQPFFFYKVHAGVALLLRNVETRLKKTIRK
jgi:hypothetical protein